MNLQEAKNILGAEYYKELVSKLRNRIVIDKYDYGQGYYLKFQLNKKHNKIAFQLFVSRDKINWVEQNSYLSIKDIIIECANMKKYNISMLSEF
jgi:hypothetical protein